MAKETNERWLMVKDGIPCKVLGATATLLYPTKHKKFYPVVHDKSTDSYVANNGMRIKL